MKIILHIGVEKTGTTSIQRFLSMNSKMLNLHQMLYYGGRLFQNLNQCSEVVAASVEEPGAHLVQLRTGGFSEFRRAVCSEINQVLELAEKQNCNQVIFSSEHMSSRMRIKREVELLRDLFPSNAEIEIVIYLRRQDRLYLGTLAEGIKAGATISQPIDKEIILSKGFYSRNYYDYELLLNLWASVFDENIIRVFCFEPVELKRNDIVHDFMTRVLAVQDLSRWNFSKNRRLNPGFSAEFLYFLSGGSKPRSVESRMNLVNNAQMLDDFHSNTFIPVHRLAEFLGTFAESNKRVAQKYLNKNSLFSAPAIAPNEYVFANANSLSLAAQKIQSRIEQESN